ncbi:ABC-type antimicrobial peptide transport system, permease component [Eubacterium ruminantium]|nr:ABC-type antimicrobial peptide transport system, permease component [Eubacterium ruminantium]
MRVINLVYISIDFMLRKIIRNAILVISLVVCVMNLIEFSYVDENSKRYRDDIKSTLAAPYDNISVLKATNVNSEDGDKQLYKLIHENKDFICASFPDLSWNYFQDKLKTGFVEQIRKVYSGSINVIIDSYDMFKMFKPNLEAGVYVTPEEAEKKYKNMYGCYLGADYKQCIPVGTVFKSTKSRFNLTQDIIVLGYLERGSKIINTEVTYPEDMSIEEAYLSLDDKILMLGQFDGDDIYYGTYLIYSKCKAKVFTEDITDSGRNEGLSFSLITLEEMLEEKEKDGVLLYGLNKKMFYTIAIVSISMILCFQIISINENNKRYGILLTNGYRSKDISMMIFIENVLKYLLAFSIAFIIEYNKLKKNYEGDYIFGTPEGYIDMKGFEKIFFRNTIPISFLIGLIVVFIAIIVPMMYLRKRPAYEYLRDR